MNLILRLAVSPGGIDRKGGEISKTDMVALLPPGVRVRIRVRVRDRVLRLELELGLGLGLELELGC